MKITQTRQRPPSWWQGWVISIFIFAFLVVFVRPPSDAPPSTGSGKSNSSSSSSTTKKVASVSGDDVIVKCDLTTPFDDRNLASSANGTLKISVHRSMAPLASNAFLEMVNGHHFDHNYIFRAVEGFIVQFGIPPERRHDKFAKVNIDPPPANAWIRSNVRGSLNFAGGNSALGQAYINRKHNPHLDKEKGSLPFATVDEQSMSIIDSIYSYKEGLGQVKAVKKGDDEVKRLFPHMSRIEKCWIDDG